MGVVTQPTAAVAASCRACVQERIASDEAQSNPRSRSAASTAVRPGGATLL
ncbi:hypothetical protein [Paenibacillus whitsoniae]|uniref:hypothetical protein n=1 Tax=Paenibacillus whitsoniae TaxID=2496558 RepID=UPI0013E04E02|nr:hypothetical protein [Paenibacillus whitsoniae]